MIHVEVQIILLYVSIIGDIRLIDISHDHALL